MSQSEAATASQHHHEGTVAVTLAVTDPDGGIETLEKTIPAGPTNVLALKAELGVPPESSLWVVRHGEKPKHLVDHASHNVKAGDHYETIVKGGVS